MMIEVSEIDKARLAAFIDGEGHIAIKQIAKVCSKTPNGTFTMIITVCNTDMRLPYWCKSLYGGAVHTFRQNNPKWNQTYRWDIAARKAEKVLQDIFPYLLLKQDQAKLALEFYLLTAPLGTSFVPQKVHERRQELRNEIRLLHGGKPNPEIPAKIA